ncbi:hypothetical protein RHMOL_Rhmol03G0273800 [Rhododendron molle]|uniref:Uncharacterized protein n=2 Tax=Rhododendron molle TaxID=49168 RepID=A0ACC0PLE2_RHOML|nr:hypothetical protein RHMOL_Rhmol03G0273800 [Rhododendron molle]
MCCVKIQFVGACLPLGFSLSKQLGMVSALLPLKLTGIRVFGSSIMNGIHGPASFCKERSSGSMFIGVVLICKVFWSSCLVLPLCTIYGGRGTGAFSMPYSLVQTRLYVLWIRIFVDM